jgi:hypothetical protein
VRAFLLTLLLICGLAVSSAHAQRIAVTSNLAVYVAPPANCAPGYYATTPPTPTTGCGNDATGTGSAAAPWATVQHALTVLYQGYDFGGLYAPTIYLASSLVGQPIGQAFFYPGFKMSGRLVGQPGTVPVLVGGSQPNVSVGIYNPFTITGDPNNPTGVFIQPGQHGFPCDNAVSLSDDAAVKITGMLFDTLACSTGHLLVFTGSFADLSYAWFGNAGSGTHSGLDQIGVAWGGAFVLITGPLTIAGGASSFIETGIDGGAQFSTNGQVPINITLAGIPSFSNGMFQASYGRIEMSAVTFSQYYPGQPVSITGAPAVAKYGGVINTSGVGAGPNTCQPSYFPSGTSPINVQDNAVCR